MFGWNKGLVGLDIGSSSVMAIELARSGRGYEIIGFAQAPLNPDVVADGAVADSAALSEAIESVFAAGKFRTKNVATGVSGNAAIVKRVVLPVDTVEEAAGSIEYNAEKYIPFDISEVNLDYAVIGPSKREGGGLEVVLVAARKDHVRNATDAVAKAGLVPIVVDIDVFALQQAFEINYSPGPDETAALFNVGASLTNINIAKAGMPLLIRDVSVGGRQYTDVLKKELQLGFEEAEALKCGKKVDIYDAVMVEPLLDSVTDALVTEVQKTFDFFRENYPEESISSIYLAGGSARAPGIARKFQEAFGIDARPLDPLRALNVNSSAGSGVRESGPALAVAVGLAMRAFDG